MFDPSKLMVGDEVGYLNRDNHGESYDETISTVKTVLKNGAIVLADGTRFNRRGYSANYRVFLVSADDVRKIIAQKGREEKFREYHRILESLLDEIRRSGRKFTPEIKAAFLKLANAIETE